MYKIWSEGFKTNGESKRATYFGNVKAENFKEACDKLFKGSKYYDPAKLTYWGCKLFDNEKDARRSFG